MTKPTPPPPKKGSAAARRAAEHRRHSMAARWSSIGIQFVISVLLGYWGGTWLDGKFGTDPWFMCIGMFAGMAAAIYDMVVLTKQSVKALKEDDSDD